jgi:molybdopterin synthase sulfur carrier subunit
MKIRIKFFAYFRELFQGKERNIELKKGTTIMELLTLLCHSEEQQKEIFDGNALKSTVVVMRNGTNVHSLNGLKTEVNEGDTIALFPLIGGG